MDLTQGFKHMAKAFLLSITKQPFFSSRKTRYIALGSILILCIFFIFRSCSLNNFSTITYHIGQDSRWGNINLMGKERNLTAFNNELLRAIAAKENFQIRIEISNSSNLISDLELGKLQGVLTSLQPNYLNENKLIFSNPYFLIGPVLVIPSTAPIENWSEKGKKIVGIPIRSPLLSSLELDPTIEIKIYGDILHALRDLNDGKIDGVMFPAIPSYTYVNTFYKNEFKIATLPLTEDAIRLVAAKNEIGNALIEHFNKGLNELKADGTYSEMLEQWGLIDVEKINNP